MFSFVQADVIFISSRVLTSLCAVADLLAETFQLKQFPLITVGNIILTTLELTNYNRIHSQCVS